MSLSRQRLFATLSLFLILAVVLTACGNGLQGSSSSETPATVTLQPTATAVPPKTLVVCLGYEPSSLYLYKESSRAMWSVLEALYDGPIDTVNFEPQPVILEALPTLENGGVTLSSVVVSEGDEVANVEGDIVALQKGVRVFPEGCSSLSCAVEWDGVSELRVAQTTASFKIKPGITWSDAQPLTAADSVFSFTVASDPSTAVAKTLIRRTAAYTALDAQTVQWTGKPGYLTTNPAAFFWTPLPQHTLGSMTAVQLNTADETNTSPLGWGPYQIDEWAVGDHIRLVKNPNYYRAGEGLPYFDVLVFRFTPGLSETDLSPLVTGECDVMETSVGLETQIQPLRELEIAGETRLYFGQGPEWESLNFGIKPASYDDVYNPYLDRQDFFGDLRTRQAFAYCVDRERIIKDVMFSRSEIPASYLPPTHPYAVNGLTVLPFDPAQGMSLLEQVGWVDSDNDPATPRVSSGVAGVLNGTKFSVTYYTTNSALHESVSDIVVSSLAECGIEVAVQYLPATEMFSAGPDGLVFGRSFDLAELAWSTGRQPPCFLYSSGEIPSAKNSWVGAKYGGVNLTGYSNADYDAACSRQLSAGLDSTAFDSDNRLTQTIFNDDLPVLPLFYHLKVMAARPDLCGVSLDVSARSGINSLESYYLSATGTCP
jgi:peptide/nickel transport system substrate-binding protein